MYNGEELVAKMKLWFVLNGYNMDNYLNPNGLEEFHPCNFCPHNIDYSHCRKLKRAWVKQGTLETKMNTYEGVQKLNLILGEVWACIEWVKQL